ncbi:hypothetical protein P9112_007091 [Eukaryota sp. TZLM1-RC]
MREFTFSLNQAEFIRESIASGIRPDFRPLSRIRDISFSLRETSCETILGNTHVFTQISSEIVKPFPDRPQEGLVYFSTSYSPLAAPDPASLDTSSINRSIERIFRETQCIESEALCITSGKAVWKISIDTTVLNDDGNAHDACVLCTSCLLSHSKLPVVFIDESGQSIVQPTDLQPPTALPLFHLPVSVTMAVVEGMLVLDPTNEEEYIADSTLSVSVNKHSELVELSFSGLPIDKALLTEGIGLAREQGLELLDRISKVVVEPNVAEDEDIDLNM